jgi:hypothetical protein
VALLIQSWALECLLSKKKKLFILKQQTLNKGDIKTYYEFSCPNKIILKFCSTRLALLQKYNLAKTAVFLYQMQGMATNSGNNLRTAPAST